MSSLNLTDEQLVVMIREKDKELYSEIIRRYKTKLTHYLRKFIHNNDELEDVLQSVFIKVYKNLYGFNVNKKFSPWIYRVTHNEAINHLKKFANKTVSLEANELEIIDDKLDIKERLDAKFAQANIEKALFSLKEKYRQPLILYYFEQKTYEEISDIMRIPINSVGTLITRGRDKLKKFLQ